MNKPDRRLRDTAAVAVGDDDYDDDDVDYDSDGDGADDRGMRTNCSSRV